MIQELRSFIPRRRIAELPLPRRPVPRLPTAAVFALRMRPQARCRRLSVEITPGQRVALLAFAGPACPVKRSRAALAASRNRRGRAPPGAGPPQPTGSLGEECYTPARTC